MPPKSKNPRIIGKWAAGFFFLSLALVSSLSTALAQEGWSLIGIGSKGNLFYDPGRMSDLGDGKMKVWTKFVYSREGVASLKSRGDRFGRAAYITIPYEVNCRARIAACQEGIIYSLEDEPLGPFQCSHQTAERGMPFPGSVSEEALLNKVCP